MKLGSVSSAQRHGKDIEILLILWVFLHKYLNYCLSKEYVYIASSFPTTNQCREDNDFFKSIYLPISFKLFVQSALVYQIKGRQWHAQTFLTGALTHAGVALRV